MVKIPERFYRRIQEAKEKQLEELDLSNDYRTNDQDKLTKIPAEVFELTHLKALKLNFNRISYLPESISNLTNLITLDLRNNNLTSLPQSIGRLSSLVRIYLDNNHLISLPDSFVYLSSLITLYIRNNNLTKLPESFGNLSNLTGLDLSNNSLIRLPESFGHLSKIDILVLNNNPFISPPLEVVNEGRYAIRRYFRQLSEKGRDYIYEAKLLIVGEAGAGKTTLAKKIYNSDYQLKEEEKSTEGIDVIQWSFPISDKEGKKQEFKVNIWDFGGQEIYHATHQFFLTKRSLYTLVADARKEDTDFYYWLNVVELLSDNSPLLIIKNEKQDRKQEINETALRGQFSNLEEILATNLATNRGLDEIITDVKHYIRKLSHIGDTLPTTWVKVRQTLESDSRNYISFQEYLDICENNGFTRHEDKLQLSQYMHDLGICLHFQDEDNSLLYKIVILKPEWGTEAVYKVLDNEQVINNQGCFTRNDLKNIWHQEKYVLMRGELLELMKKFKLCYEIPGNKDNFIAPQLLSDNQLEYDWDKSNNLILCYAYPEFMPKGIITRFIVAMHQYIDQQKYVWKSGVVLSKDNSRAEVIEYYGRREIRVRVDNSDKSRNLMTIVAYELDKINNSFKRLKYHKLIPCICNECRKSTNAYLYPYKTLQNFIDKGEKSIQCQESTQKVSISDLMNVVFTSKHEDITEESTDYPTSQNQSLVSVTIQNPQQQQGNDSNMTNINQNHSGSGDNIAGDKNTTNNYNSQNLTQAAAEIQTLLEQLEKTYPTNTTTGKMAIATEAIQQIDNDPKLTSRVLSALKAGGTSTLDSLLDHPAASFVIGALEDWQQTKND